MKTTLLFALLLLTTPAIAQHKPAKRATKHPSVTDSMRLETKVPEAAVVALPDARQARAKAQDSPDMEFDSRDGDPWSVAYGSPGACRHRTYRVDDTLTSGAIKYRVVSRQNVVGDWVRNDTLRVSE